MSGGAASRRKGLRGEQEVAAVLREFGLPADRTVHNSAVFLRGDLTGVEGYHFEVKRQERVNMPSWLEKAGLECGDAVPVVAFRRSNEGWYATLPLRDLARLLAIASLRTKNREVR